MRRHDMTNKKTRAKTKTMKKTNTMTKTMTMSDESNPRDLWLETWHLRHWSHFWQLRTTILTFTLWPLNKEWRGQHSQFLRCFLLNVFYETQAVDFWSGCMCKKKGYLVIPATPLPLLLLHSGRWAPRVICIQPTDPNYQWFSSWDDQNDNSCTFLHGPWHW